MPYSCQYQYLMKYSIYTHFNISPISTGVMHLFLPLYIQHLFQHALYSCRDLLEQIRKKRNLCCCVLLCKDRSSCIEQDTTKHVINEYNKLLKCLYMQNAVVPLYPVVCKSSQKVPSTKLQASSMIANTRLRTYQIYQEPYIQVHETCHLGCHDNTYF